MNPLVLAVDIGTSYTKIACYGVEPGGGPRGGGLPVRGGAPVGVVPPVPVGAVHRVPTPAVAADGTFDVAAVVDIVLDHLRDYGHRHLSPGNANTDAHASGGTDGTVRSYPNALSITSFLSHIFLDAQYRVLGPGLSWSYHLGDESLADVAAVAGPGARTGAASAEAERPVSSELLAPRLLSIARQDSHLARAIHHVVSLKDLLRYYLTGAPLTTDYSIRDYSLLRSRTDAPVVPVVNLLREAGFAAVERLLPPAHPPTAVGGRVTDSAAARYHLPPGLPVVTGSTDGTAGMYGGGILNPNATVMLCGTTDVVMTWKPAVPTPNSPGPGRGAISRNATATGIGEVWGASTSDSGGVRRWLEELLKPHDAPGQPRWQDVPPGAAGVRVAPGFSGERAPWNNPSLTGVIAGLQLRHHRGHVLRALLESQAYRLRLLIEELNPTGTMIITGGGNTAVDLTNLRGAILPYPLYQRTDGELSLCGAAMYGIAGIHPNPAQRLEELSCAAAVAVTPVAVTPDPHYTDHYTQWRHWITTHYGASG